MEKTETNKRALVIIPCYNEENNIVQLSEDLKSVTIAGISITPLFINDCSRDNTAAVLEKNGLNHLNNPINLGIGGTVQLGFMFANENGFDFAIQMDGDGQHPPSQLIQLLQPILNNEVDVSVGSRFMLGDGFQSSFLRRLGIKFFCQLNWILVGKKIKDSTSGYRAYNQKAICELVKYYPDEYPEPETIVYLLNKKLRIKEVPVVMVERIHGKSSIKSFSTIYYMFKVSLNTVFLHFKMKFNGNI